MNINIAIVGNKKNPLIHNLYKFLTKYKININKIYLEKINFTKKDLKIFKSRINSSYRFDYIENDKKLKKKIIYIDDVNDLKTSKIIKKNNTNLLIQMGVNKVFKKNILSSTSYGIINAHPGLLPAFRGCCPVEWAILLNKDIFVTTHIMGKKIDTGKVILIKKLNSKNINSYKNLRTEVLKLQYKSIFESIKKINRINFDHKKLKKIDANKGFYFKPINNYLLKLVKKKLRSKFI